MNIHIKAFLLLSSMCSIQKASCSTVDEVLTKLETLQLKLKLLSTNLQTVSLQLSRLTLKTDSLIQEDRLNRQRKSHEEYLAGSALQRKATLSWGDLNLQIIYGTDLSSSDLADKRTRILTELNDYFALAKQTSNPDLKKTFNSINLDISTLFTNSDSVIKLKGFITLFTLLKATFNATNTAIKSYDSDHDGLFTTSIKETLDKAITFMRENIDSQTMPFLRAQQFLTIPNTILVFLNNAEQEKKAPADNAWTQLKSAMITGANFTNNPLSAHAILDPLNGYYKGSINKEKLLEMNTAVINLKNSDKKDNAITAIDTLLLHTQLNVDNFFSIWLKSCLNSLNK